MYQGRVTAQYKGLYKVFVDDNEVIAEISGKFRSMVGCMEDYPAVGDYVEIDRNISGSGNAIIHKVLTRKSMFIRKAAGKENEIQVVAANMDFVFICMGLNMDYNLRRLERYISITWSSGAVPVVVLTKADLCEDLVDRILEVQKSAPGAEIIVTSVKTGEGINELKEYLTADRTVAFLGSSGVGKSTLINELMGNDYIETRSTGWEDKGRHTTTRREMYFLESGAALIDTPGMREIGVEDADISKAFSDIDELASDCRFKDCSHKNELGCAVKAAIENGALEPERLESYFKLKKEVKYDGLNSRQIEKEKISEMFSEFDGIKNAKKFIKTNKK